MSDKEILEKLKQLPGDKKKALEAYVDELLQSVEAKPSRKEMSTKELFGAFKGKVWMSPDFDDPIEDFKDYM